MENYAKSADELSNIGAQSQPRPRVLHVIDTLSMGGAETWLMELLRYWARTKGGPQIDFLATSGNQGIFDEEAKSLGAKIFYLRFGRRSMPSFAAGIRKILAANDYCAIHDHGDFVSGWHFLMGLGEMPPVRVAHVHSPWIHISAYYAVNPSRRFSAYAGAKLVQHLATHVCGTSGEVLRIYGYQPGSQTRPKVSVVHCGFDTTQFTRLRDQDRQSVLREFGWPVDTRVVLFAGRLDQALEFGHPQNHKNSWFAIHVIRAALQKDPKVRFLMAGDGDDPRRGIDRQIAEWGLASEMRTLGVRRDLPRLMRAADALLFPSQEEGLGMVAVEAQAAGLPVVASSSVPRECIVVPDLYHALSLVDSAESWAETLLETTVKPRIALSAIEGAFRTSPFSIEMSAQALERIYNVLPS